VLTPGTGREENACSGHLTEALRPLENNKITAYNTLLRRINLLKPFKIYLETSIFIFKFAEDSPDKKADTIKFLETDEIVEKLTDEYVEMGIIPIKFRVDGIHIAMAAIHNMDCIISLNFHHINKKSYIFSVLTKMIFGNRL
jgi:hypothetical protein